MTLLADVECWESPLRYHYCYMYDLSVCEFPVIFPSYLWRAVKSHFLFPMAAFAI